MKAMLQFVRKVGLALEESLKIVKAFAISDFSRRRELGASDMG